MERPGRQRVPTAVRVLLWLILAAIVVTVLFTTVFPWVEGYLQDPTLGSTVPVMSGGRG